MTDMVNALDISDDNLQADDNGKFVLIGNKELKVIQRVSDKYFYYIQADTKRKKAVIRNKLVSFGMVVGPEKDTSLYLSMKRLPEPNEGTYLRKLTGIKQK